MLFADIILIKVFFDYWRRKPYAIIIIIVKNLISVRSREKKIKIIFYCYTISYWYTMSRTVYYYISAKGKELADPAFFI